MCKRSLAQKKMLLLTVLQTNLLLATVIKGLSGASLQESSVARCSLFGNDHIKTFDGSLYNFAGYCSYLLAGDCHKHSFTLLGDYQDGDKIGFSVYLGEYFSLRLSLDGVVMQEEKRVSIPFASNGIFIEKEAGYYKISSNEHGFVVKIDASGNIQILLQEKHYNKTCGLCGNFNNFLEDDFRTREGTLVGNSYDFANSWALHSENKHCKRVQTPSNTCNISSDMAEKGVLETCQLLSTSLTFSRCHHRVDPEPYISLCERDICACPQGVDCHCPAFLDYARSCAHEGVILEGWPEESSCRPRCPVGMEYKECVSPCAKTCQSLNINEVCHGQCVDGCSCPEGLLLDGEHCIESSDCSCIHSGKHYPPGFTISQDCNSCICRRGMWICSNGECPGECSVTGQSHFKSFDSKYFTFSGICQYLFAKDCVENSFSVIIQTVQCADDPDAVCTRSASVRIRDMDNSIIKMKHGGGVSLNGQDIQIPLLQGALRVQRVVRSSVRLTYGDDLQIDWDGHGELLVKVSPVYSERMCGLCGNYDGNQGDDFLTPSGMVESLLEDFGNSWKLNADCQDLLKQDSDPCNLNPHLAKYAEDSCSVLMSPAFEPCHHEVSPTPYVKNCRFDVCSCSSGKDCLCSAIANYAAACARKSILVEWRQPDFCPMTCPEGQVYQQCGTPCNQTCQSLSYPEEDCEQLCLEGCYCPPGHYLDEHEQCVPKSQCSCYYDGEIFQPEDVFSDHYSMCYCENGFMHCSTNRAPGAFLADVFADERPSPRIKRSLTCRFPMEKIICPANNPRAEGVECTKTCQNYDLECISHGCISGCLCPKGMVRHENKCVAPERCPCFHNGREYSKGETVTKDCNTCVCQGRKWECTKNLCDGTCTAIGTAHYLTFDGLKYKFPGNCQYVLAQDFCKGDSGTFQILISNEGCGFTGEKCTKRVIIVYEGGEIELFNGNVNIRVPPKGENDNLDVIKSGRYYIILLGKSISVTWDLAMGVSIILKGNFKDQVCGLCGNFDGIQNNDLTSSSEHLEVDPVDFGNSWKVNSRCADVAKPNLEQTLMSPLCGGNIVKQMMVESSCSILSGTVFEECTKLVNPEPYIDICLYDTCACESVGDCACFCDTVAAYAHACAQKGVAVHWRSLTLCPQSCEDLNKQELDYQCEWRYNSCGPACPVTCQHPQALECPLQCVEGCHVHCPAGKILDELSLDCVSPEDCPVCTVGGDRIPHGRRVVLNRDDPQHCQSCLCEGKNLTCVDCKPMEDTLTLTTPIPEEDIELPASAYSCSKMMDLAFLIDGSNKLSEEDFEQLKTFIIGVMKKLHISQKKIRVSILVYRAGPTIYLNLKDIKTNSQMRRIVQNIKYTGDKEASTYEVFKYTALHVFGKAERTNAAKIAVIFIASRSQKKIRDMLGFLKNRDITVIPVGIGPHINVEQVKFMAKMFPGSRAFLVSNVLELMDHRDFLIDHLCDLGPKESLLLPATSTPTMSSVIFRPLGLTAPPPLSEKSDPNRLDIAFIVEGSDNVGEENFNKVKKFIEKVVTGMNVGQENIHVTVMQYSETVSLEYSFREIQSKENIIEKVRSIPYQGGRATNTGNALDYISKHTFTSVNGGRQDVPHLVYMVSSSPSTDVITRPPRSINVIPIGITPGANIQELRKISQPNDPIILNSYSNLIEEAPELVLQSCCTHGMRFWTEIRELCNKPMDIMFLLDGSLNTGASEFEEMKSFVRAFIESVVVGNSSIHVSVLQYARENNLEISWNMPQGTDRLVEMVQSIQQREQGPTRLGNAIDFVVQNAMSESHGGRPSASKVAIVIVSGRSEDPVEAAALSARVNRVSLFPVAVGNRYDEGQLRTLAGSSAANRIMKLQNFEDLSTMITLNSEFIKKVCMDPVRECIDEDGNKKRPGDKWTLPDQCHTVTCFPGDYTVLESHHINCERMPKPACHSSLPAVKVEETCGCRWMCPCVCIGSSSQHIVTFDGLNFKLTGNCSYTLFQDLHHDVEVLLHEGPCRAAPRMNCMDSIEVKHRGVAVQLFSDMAVTVNGERVLIPYSSSLFEITAYGEIMHEIKFSLLGHNLTFTPRNNEFILRLNSKSFSSGTKGLCGLCDQNHVNDFTLRNGSATADSSVFIQDWTVAELGKVCDSRREDRCSERAPGLCHLLLSDRFAECHRIITPNIFYEACMESSCYEEEACEMITSYAHICREYGVCVDWRTPELCPMKCAPHLMYNHCHTACVKSCDNNTKVSVCKDYPTEGCFCPDGKVIFGDSCVSEEVCTQCVSEDGTHHQHMETWIPENEPCKICTCLDNKRINCTVRPCPAVQPVQCGPCEVAHLRRGPGQCCPEYECVCDLISCDLPPAPVCEFGLQLALTNPGECRPNYTCACNREICSSTPSLSCPSHRMLTVVKTECCDKYECTCSCRNSTVSCPLGYLSQSLTNDCGCVSTTCIPDRVCVHNNIVYPVGATWEDGCRECSCSSLRDDVTGLQMTECHDKECDTFCSRGYKYIVPEGECCGRCQKTACEELHFWPRGDEDPPLHEVGTEWRSPWNHCIVNECVRVNNEVFVQQKNVSCSQMDVPDCPEGTELRCDQVIDCCPSCRCAPLNGCPLNGTVIGHGRRLMVDQCTTCDCFQSAPRKYTLRCKKLNCQACPANYKRQEIPGSCCGKCVPTSCSIRLRDGRVQYLQANTSLQDGCDSHSCRVNERGEFIWERRITGCPPFDARRCLAEGGRIAKIGNTCCDTCVEVECHPVSTRLQYGNINGCVAEKEVPISHCEGKCRSTTRYSAQTGQWEDHCSCCTATQTTTVTIPLRCPNGTMVQHYIPSASLCECRARKCTP
ncbi:von Willebrand factor [Onychostruthus taczanowskii]|uniref:von Willebrand factor n=1 Tax=Onychostruthus taczanowskii TaxID=356909 RepID=UPI001B8012C9|nr:von Willebrand factor [Onychostruthus taczanowskii]